MNEISGTTKLLCLLGSPIEHSKSPAMHNEACRLLGLDYRYLAFDVKPEQLKDAVAGLQALKARGFNLTMPLKTAMIPLADELTEAARIAGAINTVIIEPDGRLIGHTTDGVGFMRSVENEGASIIGENMVLMGAGGAACPIIAQAALDGVKNIHVFKRKNNSWDDTLSFLKHVQNNTNCNITLEDISDSDLLKKRIANSRILVNATNVGMSPNENETLVSDDMLFSDLIVSDIIYTPRETKLLKQAKQAGCTCFNGLYMLLYQGAESFRHWTGEEMPVEAVRKFVFD